MNDCNSEKKPLNDWRSQVVEWQGELKKWKIGFLVAMDYIDYIPESNMFFAFNDELGRETFEVMRSVRPEESYGTLGYFRSNRRRDYGKSRPTDIFVTRNHIPALWGDFVRRTKSRSEELEQLAKLQPEQRNASNSYLYKEMPESTLLSKDIGWGSKFVRRDDLIIRRNFAKSEKEYCEDNLAALNHRLAKCEEELETVNEKVNKQLRNQERPQLHHTEAPEQGLRK